MSNDSATSSAVLRPADLLHRIEEGAVDLAFRGWSRPRLRAGWATPHARRRRKVDEPGPTESLAIGDRVSPRGRALLDRF